VSHWQGAINWTAVANAGVAFAVVRVSHGVNTIDNYFEANWNGARAAGIPTAVYQYFEPGQNPIAQADILLDMMGPLEPGDLPPVIDVETAGGLAPAEVANSVQAWVEHVEAALGVEPIIYTGRYFWQDNVQSAAFVDHPLWIAHYTTGCPNIPSPWTRWALHQYTDSGTVAGISGPVDRNNFNGDQAALLGLAVVEAGGLDGWLDATDCSTIGGWAAIGGEAETTLEVRVAVGGPLGRSILDFTLQADRHRDDLCDALGSCSHAFSSIVPAHILDGTPYPIHAYAIDPGGAAVELQGGPVVLKCSAPVLGEGTRRSVSNTALSGWNFTPAFDVLPDDPAPLLAVGEPLADAPLLVHADGDDRVWLIDAGWRRSIQDASGWNLDLAGALTWPAASIDSVPLGPPLPQRPLLVQNDAGDLEFMDAADLSMEGEPSDDATTGSTTGEDPTGGDEPSEDQDGGTGSRLPAEEIPSTNYKGCRSGGHPGGSGSALLMCFSILGFHLRRRQS
jgi:GH25 family lysozyme M1 (1,4-beta-N-acetylmuramidase)